MKKPVILITCHWDEKTAVFSKPVLVVPQAYADSVEIAGGIPLILPYCDDDNLDYFVDMADGVIFSGGYDVNPELYGEAKKYNTVSFTEARDNHEEKLYKKWKATGKPTLGICRGLQFMNIMEGGSLHQDIPVERSTIHSDTKHDISLEKGGIMEEIFGSDPVTVNSYHHQCIKRLADVFEVTAYSTDDYIIEGIAHKTEKMFAVQYHPERQCGDWCDEGTTNMEPLFKKFVEMCKG